MNIEQQTNELLETFSKVAAGLFEVTGRYIEYFEQGTYGCAIAKPSKRMKNALAIDREVLVVVSTFKDQQQRTVKFLLQELQESQGRLETTMAVILHKDRDGNSKLRNWGRDAGISVLPLLEGESLKSTDALERALCIELYSHDPFDVTGPVSDDANFFGRRDEAIELARNLEEEECFLLGGGEIYKQGLRFCDKVYLTRVHANFEAEVFFPELDETEWKETAREEHGIDERHAYAFTFLTYERIS